MDKFGFCPFLTAGNDRVGVKCVGLACQLAVEKDGQFVNCAFVEISKGLKPKNNETEPKEEDL